VVIEDYVHCEGLKIASILAVKCVAYIFDLIGVLSILKILFWSNMVPEMQNMMKEMLQSAMRNS
jgi:hypothetical protein